MKTGFVTTGSPTADRMISIQITGNVTPVIWYKTITFADGKPDTVAISILADIVYWYRPTEKRDEQTGQLIGFQKKFKADKLQRSYKQIMDSLGISRRQAERAVNALCKLGVIQKELRDIEVGGQRLINVMYLDLNVDKLIELTYPKEPLPTLNVGGPTFDGGSLPISKVPGHTLDVGTYTETTTNNTTENTSVQIDESDVIDAYTKCIKDNIEYDQLISYLNPSDRDAVTEIVDIMVETVVVDREKIHIDKKDVPYQLVKSRFMKLGREHIEYVLECMNKTTTKINNMKAYLMTALYNAPLTMTNYYRAEANHDMYGI